jgi:predicted metal-dependent peptidase
MSEDFLNKLKYSRTYLLLTSPFFGTLVMGIQVLEVEGPGKTAWIDGKNVKFNKSYVQNISREVFITVLLHQILHVVFQHKKRGITAVNKAAWNYACDIVVNNIIVNTVERFSEKMKLPTHMIPIKKHANQSAEEIYEVYKSKKNELDELDLFLETIDMDDVDYAELTNILVRAESAARMQGQLPLGISREYNFLMYPKIDWRIMLKEFIQSFPNDWDFSNRDRRFMNSPFYLPSLAGEKIQIALAIDTSGSISHDEISQFMTESYSILAAYQRVEIIMMCCDAAVHNVKKVTSLQEATSFNVTGGGGTDFRPVFEKLKDFHSEFDALIFFTDGHGTFPTNLYSNYKVLWIMTTEVKAPFGNTIRY